MKRSEMRSLLQREGIRLTRSLGQSFLHDGGVLRRIVELADLQPTDSVLEVGPGLGPLTEALVDRVPEGKVLAIEKDSRLGELLRARIGGRPNLELRVADALEVIRQEPRDWGAWRMVANLPYSVASPILVELAQLASPPSRMVVTLQREVVERVRAAPNCRDYGVLTLFLQLRYRPVAAFGIGRGSFFPEPGVDSACVRLERREEPLLARAEEVRVFERLVRRAFSQRRKMIPKLLRQDWAGDRVEAAMAMAGVQPQARAEHVSLEQYVFMARQLAGVVDQGAG